ncbi:hypothetical protein LJC59_00925 [Desulfovibrio sp. OttesenSCG-928-A18]|nr:hypothetical protein [Desulfovibrio sp. OttesenSCG-928-A18]
MSGRVSTEGERQELLEPLILWWRGVSPEHDPMDLALLKAATARAAGVDDFSRIKGADVPLVKTWLHEIVASL